MVSASPVDAYERVAARAQDVRDAFRAGAVPLNDDVRTEVRVAPTLDPLSVVRRRGVAGHARRRRHAGLRTRRGALAARRCAAYGRRRRGARYPRGDARGAVPVPLRVPEIDAALGRAADAYVERDGTVAYTRAPSTRAPARAARNG